VNPQAKVTLQGPHALSAAQTRTLQETKDPFWNEKFVFGVEEVHMESTYICAEIVSMQDEEHEIKLGAMQPVYINV